MHKKIIKWRIWIVFIYWLSIFAKFLLKTWKNLKLKNQFFEGGSNLTPPLVLKGLRFFSKKKNAHTVITQYKVALVGFFWAAKSGVQIFAACRNFLSSCKNFSMMRKYFCSLKIFAIFVKTHFFIKHLISKVFEKLMRLASKIFAWWEKIFACCKNLHPWFCSLEKPH